MPGTFTHKFDAPVNKSTAVNTGLFINNEWVNPIKPELFEVTNPATGNPLTRISIGTVEDVDIAVKAARKAFETVWGLNCPGNRRGLLLWKLAELLQRDFEEIAAIEALNTGNPLVRAKLQILGGIQNLQYFAGWAGKTHGKTMESGAAKFAYTRHEPIGVCGQIIPWNVPLLMFIWKICPALATGCTVVIKPSEMTPLSALRFCDLIKEAGFPPGVVNLVNGYGHTVGQSITEHMDIDKVAFTGSTFTGRQVIKAAADSNLKRVSVELGGKSPNIIFDDADLDRAVSWAESGIYSNAGQICSAGTRIFVQEGIYDAFLSKFTERAAARTLGGPFEAKSVQGPQISATQFKKILGYISTGKKEGATLHLGGEQHGSEGYFIKPTIFTEVTPKMTIAREEIFGPVVVIIKFKTEQEAITLANDTAYGLACAVFSENINRALRVAHSLQAGSAYINCYGAGEPSMPFGGYKQSGWGRDLGEYALENYTEVKAVHVNISTKL